MISLVCLTLLGCGDQREPVEQGSGAVQPNRSIAGIEMGMSAAEVRERLGAPNEEKPSELHAGLQAHLEGLGVLAAVQERLQPVHRGLGPITRAQLVVDAVCDSRSHAAPDGAAFCRQTAFSPVRAT